LPGAKRRTWASPRIIAGGRKSRLRNQYEKNRSQEKERPMSQIRMIGTAVLSAVLVGSAAIALAGNNPID
jgi:hypothetical protein